MAIINLDNLINRTTSFTIDGELVKVQEISKKMFDEILEIENIEDTIQATQKQLEFLVKALNRNTSGRKFTVKELENWPRAVLVFIWRTLIDRTLDIAIDPN